MDAQPRQQPIANEGPDNSDYQIPNEPESATVNEFSCQPSGNNADQYDDGETFVG
jgi:hypothetical protein